MTLAASMDANLAPLHGKRNSALFASSRTVGDHWEMGRRTFQESKLEPWQIEDAARLAALVKSCPLKQADIAAKAGFSAGYLSQLTSARRALTRENAVELSSVLGVRLDRISPRLADELLKLAQRGKTMPPSPDKSVRVLHHWVSPRAADVAADFEQLPDHEKEFVERYVLMAVAAAKRGETTTPPTPKPRDPPPALTVQDRPKAR